MDRDSSQLPHGLRVLAVVDDDRTCLKILENLLQECKYLVTVTDSALTALALLRERKDRQDQFDLIISDVHVPEMDGFKLLEIVVLEMDLPVIMLSANGDPQNVMRGVLHGACDFLLKPVRLQELRNIWQHVIRRANNKQLVNSGSGSSSDDSKRGQDQLVLAPLPLQQLQPHESINEASSRDCSRQTERENLGSGGSRRDSAPGNIVKKRRFIWTLDLHRKFVSTIDQLGIDKAVPKKIMELMNEPGLTRENIASHLQKYRTFLKKAEDAESQPPAVRRLIQNLMDFGF